MDLNDFEKELLVWKPCADALVYRVGDDASPEAGEVVTTLVRASALPHTGTTCELDSLCFSGAIADLVNRDCIVEHTNSRYTLTEQAVKHLRSGRMYSNPEPALALDDSIPICDRTNYHLVSTLVKEGWT